MDSKFIAEIKSRLLQQKTALQAQVNDSSKQGTSPDDEVVTRFPQYGISPDDNALEVSNYQDSISVQHGLQEELDQIERALKQIEQGTYGTCSNCGQAIPKERLKIFPAATVCVACSKAKS